MPTLTPVTHAFGSTEAAPFTFAIGTNRSARIAMDSVREFHVHGQQTALNGATVFDVFIDKSNNENPDATADADWILGTSALDLATLANRELTFAQGEVPRFIRARVEVTGGPPTGRVLVARKEDV